MKHRPILSLPNSPKFVAEEIVKPHDGEWLMSYALRISKMLNGAVMPTMARDAVFELLDDLVFMMQKHQLLMTEEEAAEKHNLGYLKRMMATIGQTNYIDESAACRREQEMLDQHLDGVHKRLDELPLEVPLPMRLVIWTSRGVESAMMQ